MKKEFKVGDRACYRWTDNELRKGVIKSIANNGQVTLAPIPVHRFVTDWVAHISWLKRLVKPERREWKGTWSHAKDVPGNNVVFWPGGYMPDLETLLSKQCHVREVKVRK